jgi:hypothetical protein
LRCFGVYPVEPVGGPREGKARRIEFDTAICLVMIDFAQYDNSSIHRKRTFGGHSPKTKVAIMKRLALSIVASAAILCFDIPGSHAQGNAPWCAVMEVGSGGVERFCEYYTIEACVPNVIAGNRGFCQMNPYYTPPPPGAAYPRHHWRRHRPH